MPGNCTIAIFRKSLLYTVQVPLILWDTFACYFQNNSLCYVMRTGDEKKVLEPDLRICMVRGLDDIDRRYCFELISPHNKHVLQADNDDLYDLWLATLRQRYLPPPNFWNNKNKLFFNKRTI